MKRNRFTEEQVIRILKKAESSGQTVTEICRKHGVVEQTFYRWRKKYGGLEVKELRRLKEYEQENGRLKRLLAERDLEIDAMKDLLSKNGERSSAPSGSKISDLQNDFRTPCLSSASAKSFQFSLCFSAAQRC